MMQSNYGGNVPDKYQWLTTARWSRFYVVLSTFGSLMAKIYLTTIDDVDIARIADLLKKRDIAPVDLMTVTPPDGLSARVLLNLSRQDIDANESHRSSAAFGSRVRMR